MIDTECTHCPWMRFQIAANLRSNEVFCDKKLRKRNDSVIECTLSRLTLPKVVIKKHYYPTLTFYLRHISAHSSNAGPKYHDFC